MSAAIKIEISDELTGDIVHRFRNFGEDNGLVATLVHWHARTGRFDFTKLASVPWSITFAALAITSFGLWLMRTWARFKRLNR